MHSVFDIAGVRPLDTKNSRIVSEEGFPVLDLLSEEGEDRVGIFEAKRAFPFEKDDEFIVLLSEEGKDLGFIRTLGERAEQERELLQKELNRRYFMPVITKIHKVKEQFAFSYWKVDTNCGPLEFSVRDTYKSLIHLGHRIIITDADGNRYDLPDYRALDRSSRKQIDLYLW